MARFTKYESTSARPFFSFHAIHRSQPRCFSEIYFLTVLVVVILRVAIRLAVMILIASCSVTGFTITILISIVLYKFPLSLPLRELC
jgi:hypothetical protein